MHSFNLMKNHMAASFYVEESTDEGIRRVADKVVADFNRVFGSAEELHVLAEEELPKGENIVLFGYCSPLVEALEEVGKLDLSNVRGKWEVYASYVVEAPFEGVNKALVITGSDKRGTIYGMFSISEMMGVSPLCFWGDAVIPHKDELVLSLPETFISKEPSVKYRGFFINDEWPCFGNWTMSHFGGFNAKMYDNVFELLLRLKGNYLWPAMWTSSFALDGPGEAAAELADAYGIVMGNSHHEPCLRASEEWDKVRGEDSIYGNAWNFNVNREGLLKYWEDGLKRSARWESMVTVGMRGERDSKVLGEEATLKDNIDLLKDIIHCQKELIHNAEAVYDKELPMLLALYKEVEPFYFGDSTTEGLCDWEELQDVILMLCEDNFGYMRALPDEKMKKHPAGFGMYYHLDYHGGPVSYEWVNSTPLIKIWEQMSQAYEYGVDKVWIVNVGDLKHNEFPLSYFMNLAYDFECWGTAGVNRQKEYTLQTLQAHFGGVLTDSQLKEAEWLLSETVRLNGFRRPETLDSTVYHPCHYGEAERMLLRAEELQKRAVAFLDSLACEEKEAAYSLFGFAAQASANLLKLHLYAGQNHMYAAQGRKSANALADKVTECIAEDKRLAEELAAFKEGKWSGMEMAAHIGFTKWNEDGCRYPLRMLVEPVGRPRMQISAVTDDKTYDKVYGSPMRLVIEDFCFEPVDKAAIDICNTGSGVISYTIKMPDCRWLSCDALQGSVEVDKRIVFSCDRSLLTENEESALVTISDTDTAVEVLFKARKQNTALPAMTFLPGKEGFVMEARHFAEKKEQAGCQIKELKDYGIAGSGMKAYPNTCDFMKGMEPALGYRMFVEEEGDYTCEIWFAPTNPLKRDGKLRFGVQVNDEAAVYANTVSDRYQAGEYVDQAWSYGVLSHRRVCKIKIALQEGMNELWLLLADAGLVAEKIFVYKENKKLLTSYLGPQESWYAVEEKCEK